MHLFYGHRLHKLSLSIKSRLCNCQLSWHKKSYLFGFLFVFVSIFCLYLPAPPPSLLFLTFFPQNLWPFSRPISGILGSNALGWLVIDLICAACLVGLLFLLALCLSVSILCKNACHQSSAFPMTVAYLFLFTKLQQKIADNKNQWKMYVYTLWFQEAMFWVFNSQELITF